MWFWTVNFSFSEGKFLTRREVMNSETGWQELKWRAERESELERMWICLLLNERRWRQN